MPPEGAPVCLRVPACACVCMRVCVAVCVCARVCGWVCARARERAWKSVRCAHSLWLTNGMHRLTYPVATFERLGGMRNETCTCPEPTVRESLPYVVCRCTWHGKCCVVR